MTRLVREYLKKDEFIFFQSYWLYKFEKVLGKMKSILTENSVPFFGLYSDIYIVYILSNKIFGFDSNGRGFRIWSNKALFLLAKLLKCKEAAKIFPTKLQQLILEEKLSPAIQAEKLFGREEIYHAGLFCDYCFDLDFSFDSSLEKPAVFQNLTYQKHPLDRKIHLSLEEAAYILANISTASIAEQYGENLVAINSGKQLNDFISKTTDTKSYSTGIFQFSVYYFKYIQHRLTEQDITPNQLLNYSGLDILLPMVELPSAFDFLKQVMEHLLQPEEIPIPQLVLYYIFLERAYSNLKFMKDDQKITILLEYYLKNENYLKKLRSELLHPFPNSKEDLWKIESF